MIRRIVKNEEELSAVCEEVLDFNLITLVIKDMVDTAHRHQVMPSGCVGLAANQIGEPYRVIIIWHESKWLVMVNPKIQLIKGLGKCMKETCLSRPGVIKKMKRNKKLIANWFDEYGHQHTKKFTGFTARIIQHEVDHLNGVYI